MRQYWSYYALARLLLSVMYHGELDHVHRVLPGVLGAPPGLLGARSAQGCLRRLGSPLLRLSGAALLASAGRGCGSVRRRDGARLSAGHQRGRVHRAAAGYRTISSTTLHMKYIIMKSCISTVHVCNDSACYACISVCVMFM